MTTRRRPTDYEYKLSPDDKCVIEVRPKGSTGHYETYGTFTTPQQARRILAMLPQHVTEDGLRPASEEDDA